MKASDEGRVRALDQRPAILIHRASPFTGSSARWRRGDVVWLAPLDVFRAVGNAFADEDADFVSRDGLDRPVDAEATPGCELDGEEAQVAPHGEAAQHGIVGRPGHERTQDA